MREIGSSPPTTLFINTLLFLVQQSSLCPYFSPARSQTQPFSALESLILFDHVVFETLVFTNRPSVGSWMDLHYRFLFTHFAHVYE